MRILLVALILVLGACSSTPKDAEPAAVETAQEIFEKAEDARKDKRYMTAKDLYEEVERKYPYSEQATQAQLMGAYTAYLDLRYEDAVLGLDRFIELHPGHERVDYAYYLKSLCYYEQISDVRRDQKMTADALESFNTLLRRFPESEYRREIILKRDLTMDHLAGKEMEIGRYYLNRGHVNAAINRFLVVVRQYQTTTHTAEALHRLVESYLTLGVKDEAQRIAAVLGYNYPGSEWYERSYNLMDEEMRQKMIDDRDIFDRTVDSLFKPD